MTFDFRSPQSLCLLSAFAVALSACSATGQAPHPMQMAPTAELSARGIDPRRVQDTVRLVLERALRDSAFPGAFAVVGNRAGVIVAHGVGRLDPAPNEPTPDEQTVWDMASLTKVISLTSAVTVLVGNGTLDLDARVQRYLPEWTGQWKDQVTVRDLMTHSAGLPSWRPLYKETTTAVAARALVLSTPLEVSPGQRMVYSDLGAILVGLIVERLSGTTLDRFVAQHVFGPLGMTSTRYLPPASWRSRIAPTEVDPWRQRHLRGEVHDENAHRLGGVSAHAGLFSTGADLSRFARMMLNGGTLDGTSVFDADALTRVTAVQKPALSHRAIGWETANGANSGGQRMSRRAFGHTGFTGTSIWMDPERDVFIILLTNRVNPTRENRRIGDVRVSLANAVMGVL